MLICEKYCILESFKISIEYSNKYKLFSLNSPTLKKEKKLCDSKEMGNEGEEIQSCAEYRKLKFVGGKDVIIRL